MGGIVLVDTSVLLNILDVPGRNQHRDAVLADLGVAIEASDHLFIPMAAIIEVGNHIAKTKDGDRHAAATRFVVEVRKALRNEAPWKPIHLPSNEEVLSWLARFPEAAARQMGMADLAIEQEWQQMCDRFPMSRVRVWALDGHLTSLDRLPT
jgi:predicted nucleic acid-binding protein